MSRQKTRRLLLIVSLLFFPVTLYYLSPVLILTAGLEGIINGSFIIFAALLVGGVFFGRLFCAYLCPAGGLQECAFLANDKAPKQGWRNSIKYGIWAVWIAAVIFCYIHQGQIVRIDFFYQTEHGVSVSNIYGYIVYYGIVLLILIPALLAGKRAFCHYFCWMAPFMVIGTKIRTLLHLPGLRVALDREKCVSCHLCGKACPMSIDATGGDFLRNPSMAPDFSNQRRLPGGVRQDQVVSAECIQCGACIDACPRKALAYRMKKGD